MNEQNTGWGIHTLTDKENTQIHRRLQTSSCTFPSPNRATNTHVPTYADMRIYEGKQRLSLWFTN